MTAPAPGSLRPPPPARGVDVRTYRPLTPLLKWPGGKGAELAWIVPRFPAHIGRYLEPFVGGGAAFFAQPPGVPAAINDLSADLMAFYGAVRAQDPVLFELLDGIDAWWRAIADVTQGRAAPLVALFRDSRVDDSAVVDRGTRVIDAYLEVFAQTVPGVWAHGVEEFVDSVRETVPRKLLRMRRVQATRGRDLPEADVWSNLEGAFKAACYSSLRTAYNRGRRRGDATPEQAARFFFLREYAYAAMFRFNASGDFNVPYGGISYNRKDFAGKVAHARSDAVVARLRSATLAQVDFEAFLRAEDPGPDDFVFLDPPYDSVFSTYDRRGFDRADHGRLAAWMRTARCRFQLVIRSTPAVLELYDHPAWSVAAVDKTYAWTIKQRNDRRATHLVISNYDPPIAA